MNKDEVTMITLSEARLTYAPTADPEGFRFAMFRVMHDACLWDSIGPRFDASVVSDRAAQLLEELGMSDEQRQ